MEQLDYTIKKKDILNLGEMNAPPPQRGPTIDKAVSDIVGKPIKTTDPRLIKLIVKWKQNEAKGDDDKVNSNYLEDEDKIRELKETFN